MVFNGCQKGKALICSRFSLMTIFSKGLRLSIIRNRCHTNAHLMHLSTHPSLISHQLKKDEVGVKPDAHFDASVFRFVWKYLLIWIEIEWSSSMFAKALALTVIRTYAENFTHGNKKKSFTNATKTQPIHKTVSARNIIVHSMKSPRLRSLTHLTNCFERNNRTPKIALCGIRASHFVRSWAPL